VAVHVPAVDAWYIIPVDGLNNVKGVRLFPHLAASRSRWEEFREAWELMETGETG